MFAATVVGDRRDNVVANLVHGLALGFARIGEPLTRLPLGWRRTAGNVRPRLDPRSIPAGCRVLLVPYWITGKLWDINFAEIRDRRPEVTIATYTGVSPFPQGCPSPGASEGFYLQPGTADRRRRDNFAAIDVFLVVKAPPEGNPSAVKAIGMGRLPELSCGPKARAPFVILDFLKRGWDRAAYLDAACRLAVLMRELAELEVLILGANPLEKEILPRTGRAVRWRAERVPFDRLAHCWARSWATVCHNESFGYSVIENGFSGTRVYASPLAELPAWHRPEPMQALAGHLADWSAMSGEGRQRAAEALAGRYEREHPDLCSWTGVARRIAGAFC
jgi:hypothetical protein